MRSPIHSVTVIKNDHAFDLSTNYLSEFNFFIFGLTTQILQ